MSDHTAADDLVVDVFAKAIEAERAGKGCNSHFKGWLFRIAHNLIIDYYRDRDRRNYLSLDEVAEVRLEWQPSPYDLYVLSEERHWLERNIPRLTDEQAEVVRLMRAGYSYAEIADLMGKNEGAVKAHRRRALEHFWKMLEHEQRTFAHKGMPDTFP